MFIIAVELCSKCGCVCFLFIFFFKQKTAYEMRISDWSSDVCSSDLDEEVVVEQREAKRGEQEGIEFGQTPRSEERRVGKSVSVRVDLGGRRIIKKKKKRRKVFYTYQEMKIKIM